MILVTMRTRFCLVSGSTWYSLRSNLTACIVDDTDSPDLTENGRLTIEDLLNEKIAYFV